MSSHHEKARVAANEKMYYLCLNTQFMVTTYNSGQEELQGGEGKQSIEIRFGKLPIVWIDELQQRFNERYSS